MRRLIPYELQKIWCRRSFLLLTCILFAINAFFLWYASLGGEGEPKLSSYKRFQARTGKMSEAQKRAYMEEYKQTIDGVIHVRSVLALQNSEMGAVFAEEEKREHPGMFETYYDFFVSDEYLRYTESLELESKFVNSLYEEAEKVAGYGDYLTSVQECRSILEGISIFSAGEEDDFSTRNIQKSAADYGDLTTEGICWMPAKPVVSAMESPLTDILLILSTVLFTGSLVLEEKQKALILVTRSTKNGLGRSILAKLSALLIHCMVVPVLFYGGNCLYFGLTAGWCNWNARLQSLAPYLESNLSVSILGYLLLSVITKGVVLFGAGALLAAVCILAENMILPYFAGGAYWTVSWVLYEFIPGASGWSPLKSVNPYGAMRCEKLYGAYCNLNLWGHPISRTALSWMGTGLAVIGGIVFSFVFYRQGRRLQISRGAKRRRHCFRPHACLLRHEGYKILITNHALVILLAFSGLLAYYEFTRTYAPSVQEQYYQDIMLRLEGRQTDEKSALIAAEEARYREAFGEIDKIEAAVASGELDEETGRSMKSKWQGIIAFYPAFQRVAQQHQFVCEHGGEYIYDTGYLYLLGIRGDDGRNVFLLVTLGIILAFSQVISMEYQSGAWAILFATAKGKRSIMARKAGVCLLSAAVFLALPLVCRFISVSAVFPIRGLLSGAGNIPIYRGWTLQIPAVVPILAKLLAQMLCGVVLTFAVLAFSGCCRNHARAIFLGFLVLCVPVILTVLGFDFAQWLSLYPLYSVKASF